jgi:hypothetical protein
MFIEGERKRKGIGYRIVKIYRYEETLEQINLGYNLRIHYKRKNGFFTLFHFMALVGRI